jgi:16S rRNA (uracil1498-N3)-methyltransferase
MPRFFVSDPIIAQKEIRISGQEAHHIQRVLRLQVGDQIDIFDGRGKEYRTEIMHQGRQTVTVRILEAKMPDREAPLTVIMGQSLLKGDKMDFVVQKATEMGITDLVPFVSCRSVSRIDREKIEHRLRRWRRIAVESSKQCGRVVPLRVARIVEFDEVLHRAPGAATRIILWERATGGLKSLFRDWDRTWRPSESVFFLVGPEGGFSEKEVRRAEETHFTPVRLGSRILRVETAGLSFVTILQYEWGDLG